MAKSEFLSRLPVVIFGVPLVLGLAYLGSWPLGSLVALIAAVGVHEFYALADAGAGQPFRLPGVAAVVALILIATARPELQAIAPVGFAIVLGLTLLCFALCIWLRWPGGQPISAVSATVAGAVYVGGAMAFIPLLRHMPASHSGPPTAWAGTALLFFPIAVTWVGDSCAYLGGRALGKKKLIPHVSPGKTIAGSVASLAGSMVFAAAYVAFFLSGQRPGLTVVSAAVMGILLSAAAQIGDLVASVAKREAGVKDSGTLFPGHGGALDRLDALLFTIPLTYLLLRVAEALA